MDDLSLSIELYYCDRFDPEGIQDAQKAELKLAIQSWLAQYGRQVISSKSLVDKSADR